MSHERDFLERAPTEKLTLISLLSNSLILEHTIPYLPVAFLLNLSETSKPFHTLVTQTPRVFRHLDLTDVKSVQFDIDQIDQGGEIWRNVQLDENLTEDDFCSGPLRGIFSNLQRRHLLQDVRTLVLDGLSVTAELVRDILIDPSFNVRILSIREVKNINERKLQMVLKEVCEAMRSNPDSAPRLKALYWFGSRDSTLAALEDTQKNETKGHMHHIHGKNVSVEKKAGPGVGAAVQVSDAWYTRKGAIITRPIAAGWAETLQKCADVISFDAPLCTGPRHSNSRAYGANPYLRLSEHRMAVATIALGGCSGCGKAPEGLTYHGGPDGKDLPVVAPVPAFSSAAKAARRPRCADQSGEAASFVARCAECIRNRHCVACNQWWCEACYLDSKDTTIDEPLIVDTDNYAGNTDFMDYLASTGSYSGGIRKVRICLLCKETWGLIETTLDSGGGSGVQDDIGG